MIPIVIISIVLFGMMVSGVGPLSFMYQNIMNLSTHGYSYSKARRHPSYRYIIILVLHISCGVLYSVNHHGYYLSYHWIRSYIRSCIPIFVSKVYPPLLKYLLQNTWLWHKFVNSLLEFYALFPFLFMVNRVIHKVHVSLWRAYIPMALDWLPYSLHLHKRNTRKKEYKHKM